MRATKQTPAWAACPAPPAPPQLAPDRWGIRYGPTRQWLAFGPEVRCRALVTRLTAAALAALPGPRQLS